MYTQVEKSKEKKCRLVAIPVAQKKPIIQLETKPYATQTFQLRRRNKSNEYSKVENKEWNVHYGERAGTGIRREKAGTMATVILGPRSDANNQNKPDPQILNKTITTLDDVLETAGGWIRGHLWNGLLGGSGKTSSNLTPMSHTTNMNWNRNFEEPMKKIVERLNAYYQFKKPENYYLLLKYTADTKGTYLPASKQGVQIPNEIIGDYSFLAWNIEKNELTQDENAIESAWKELDMMTINQIKKAEKKIIKTTKQTH